jgi:hypothetical protein
MPPSGGKTRPDFLVSPFHATVFYNQPQYFDFNNKPVIARPACARYYPAITMFQPGRFERRHDQPPQPETNSF